MAFAAPVERPEIQVEASPTHDVLPAAVRDVRSSLEPESITELAAHWRAAHTIAEAQERRLAAVQTAAAKLYSPGQPEPAHTWRRQAESIDASLGVPALEQAANCAWKVVDELALRLLALRPVNVQEAALKYGVLMTIVQTDDREVEEPDRLRGFLDDLMHLAETGAN